MKKLFIIILIISLCMTMLAGCGNKKEDDTGKTAAPTTGPTAAPTQEATDISGMQPEEYFNFDPATGTLNGFQLEILGVTDIVIPAKITGADVRIIASNAFNGVGLKSVVFPETLDKIETNAFANNFLTQIELPNNISSLGIGAFEKNDITEVVIPESITKIDIGVFSSNKLTKITLPDTITSIGRNAFATNLLTEVIIPPLVKVIGSFAFADNLIENVEFNNGLERIDGRAFSINKLTSITIPASVQSIGLASEGATPPTNYERFVFSYNPQINSVTMLGSNAEIEPFFLAENNNFRMAYTTGGAGTYTGSQYGKWEKID